MPRGTTKAVPPPPGKTTAAGRPRKALAAALASKAAQLAAAAGDDDAVPPQPPGRAPMRKVPIIPRRRSDIPTGDEDAVSAAADEEGIVWSPAGNALLPDKILPGVYRNARGTAVDRRGIMIGLKDLRAKEAEVAEEVIGITADSPAALMKAVALDPRYPIDVRLAAAKDAAPYYDRKMPVSVENKNTNETKGTGFDLVKLGQLPVAERTALLATLQKLGVTV